MICKTKNSIKHCIQNYGPNKEPYEQWEQPTTLEQITSEAGGGGGGLQINVFAETVSESSVVKTKKKWLTSMEAS